MKGRFLLFIPAVLALFLLISQFSPLRASANVADCYAAASGSSFTFDFTFDCTNAQTVYFGTCDSGPALDDFFSITFKGNVVAHNDITGGGEIIYLGTGDADAGSNMATLNVILAPDLAPTYSYAVSSDVADVEAYLTANCGGDIDTFAPLSAQGCSESVKLFTADVAPSDGTLEMHILLGNEGARGDEQIRMSWDIDAGTQINNAAVSNLSAPRYARVWWQPDGSSEWYMLTSQYWSAGSWTTDQEYGITCGDGQPSYHTSFASAVAESDVCFDLMNGCN